MASISCEEPVRAAAVEVRQRAQAYREAMGSRQPPAEVARRRAQLERAVRTLDDAVSRERSPDRTGRGSARGGGGPGHGPAPAVAATETLVDGRGSGGAVAAGAGRLFTGGATRDSEGGELAATLPAEARTRLTEGRLADPPEAFKRQVQEYFRSLLEQRR
ncbi:MAG: hypothetical protein HY815_19450 [Candidatus Riflebacteria bacterium]|nr:hypothetical protein [Candidatus Riflebacteria bacterium]